MRTADCSWRQTLLRTGGIGDSSSRHANYHTDWCTAGCLAGPSGIDQGRAVQVWRPPPPRSCALPDSSMPQQHSAKLPRTKTTSCIQALMLSQTSASSTHTLCTHVPTHPWWLTVAELHDQVEALGILQDLHRREVQYRLCRYLLASCAWAADSMCQTAGLLNIESRQMLAKA